jgi:hypothetical protein
MPTIPRRIATAFAVFCGRYGDVTHLAQERQQSRQSLYREADRVAAAVDGTAASAHRDELRRQLAEQQAEIQALQQRLERAVEITPQTQREFAAVAQAEGVSLSTARRLLQVVTATPPVASVAALGRASSQAATRAGALLAVLDEAARPQVRQGAAAEIFLADDRP